MGYHSPVLNKWFFFLFFSFTPWIKASTVAPPCQRGLASSSSTGVTITCQTKYAVGLQSVVRVNQNRFYPHPPNCAQWQLFRTSK